MGLRILAAGHPLTVWARRPETLAPLEEAGAVVVERPADVTRVCDVLLVMLQDLAQLRELLPGDDGLLAGVDHPVTVVVGSTESPAGVVALADELAQRTNGLVRVVDAPVSGGERGAIDGTLSVMVGGEAADVARVLPMLRACGNPVHLGPLGAGSVGKACNQIIVAATTAALGEAAVLAERSRLDVGALFDLMKDGFAGSRLLELKRDRFVHHDHSPSAAARFMIKDLGFALEQAAKVHAAAPLTGMLRAAYADLTAKGMGDMDASVFQEWVEALEA